MYVTVSCLFLMSFVISVNCTGHCSEWYGNVWGGGGSALRKIFLHLALEARYDTAF
jgi:hypothetical protein